MTFDPNELIRQAIVQRMELLQTELQIAAETANVAAARTGALTPARPGAINTVRRPPTPRKRP